MTRGRSRHRPRNDERLFENGVYPFIQTGDVANSDGRIRSADKFYSEFGLAQSRLFPAGTLCITIAANIANTAILDIDACFPDSVVGVIVDKEVASTEYLEYLMRTVKDDLAKFAPATAQKNINNQILSDLQLPIAPLAEQRRIVARIEELTARSKTAKAALQAIPPPPGKIPSIRPGRRLPRRPDRRLASSESRFRVSQGLPRQNSPQRSH